MIYVTGDTHGEVDIMKLSNKKFPQGKNLTKKDYVIVMGDFGVIFNPVIYNQKGEPLVDRQEKYLLNFLNERKFTTLFIRGNHDNYPKLETFPDVEMFGSTVKQISDSVFYLLDSHIYNIDGNSVFCLGGAESVDKMYRREGVSWWREEIPSYKTIQEGFDLLKTVGNKVDYVFSHAIHMNAYTYIYDEFGEKYNDPMNKILQILYDTIECKKYYCGHYHQDIDIPKYRTRMLYNRIVPLGE